MKTQLLSAVFAIAGAALLLGLRHLLVYFGNKKAGGSAASRHQIFMSRAEDERVSVMHSDLSQHWTDPEIDASPLRVEEFLARLRAKTLGGREESEADETGSPFHTA